MFFFHEPEPVAPGDVIRQPEEAFVSALESSLTFQHHKFGVHAGYYAQNFAIFTLLLSSCALLFQINL